ncbi:MAG: polymer-forming cytoskeletal protein [Wenzhouxiangellaceae bacterium]|nr:polymer-forming cytoskeletal protein [Wenzhouxiangellaceae bacterium]MBS3747224.1 polymer-forming cytoskeletal protein [Wenzhouxiangellaceae bacterium]MBS3823232.1 polymer-forming cytoskeletal protein [Wenzhouxiangellaceae bacterium]
MAIFGKDRAQQGTDNGSTVIAAGSDFVGNITLKDTLHVDGRIDGDVESESNVVIGENGRIKGRITAETVVVSGQVDGSVSAGRLEIIAGGCVEGDVHIVDLVIEPGGRFNGSSEILASRMPEAATEDSGPAGRTGAAGGESTKSARKKSSSASTGPSAEAPDRTPSTA